MDSRTLMSDRSEGSPPHSGGAGAGAGAGAAGAAGGGTPRWPCRIVGLSLLSKIKCCAHACGSGSCADHAATFKGDPLRRCRLMHEISFPIAMFNVHCHPTLPRSPL